MESSPLDFVAQSCMDLTEAVTAVTTQSERDTLINNHIKKVWSAVSPVEDFKKSCEWVNVSEPISLSQHCSDKIVVLDFWTYCCINCYHVLPDLAELEKAYGTQSGLVVIGVHSAKFSNEKVTQNVLSAVQRYNIMHPVVNDMDCSMWEALGIRCWPTLLILGPGNKPIFVLTGEGHKHELMSYVKIAIRHFGTRLSKLPLPVDPFNYLKPLETGVLKFPGKIALNPFYRGREEEPYLAISDTGNNRIVITDVTGLILRRIGGPEPGFKDGKFSEARFNSPQGLCWMKNTLLAVCDTNNHSIRTVHLDDGMVESIGGTGVQSEFGDMGGKCLDNQPLSSPWDIQVYTTPDLDMSVRSAPPPPPPPAPSAPPAPGAAAPPPPPADKRKDDAKKDNQKKEKEKDTVDDIRRVLLIACAGSHQIWAIFLDTTIWWKYKTYKEGSCVCIAGSGAEAARNSAYPAAAAFAQPSALALRTASNPEVFIADSESSSIRRMSLTNGSVSTLCGGDRNPLDLFAYGDIDDIGQNAKFQHPLGLAYSASRKVLYVADTYNHKIRKVDIGPQKVSTLHPTVEDGTEIEKFNEPSGLSLSTDWKLLFVADTNNHKIKVIDIAKNICSEFKVRLPEPDFVEPDNLILYKNDLFVNRKCGNLIIYFNVSLDSENTVKFTPGAPQNWKMCIRDEHNKDVTLEDFEFVNCSHKGTILPGRVEMKLKHRTDKNHYRLYLSFHTAICDLSLCFTHPFTIRSSILVRDSVKPTESYKITCKVNPVNRREVKSEKSEL